MTTEQDRTLGELLLLDSYQDMSDSEIELVIEHKVRQARLEGQNSEVCQTVTSQMQAIRDMTSDMYDISAATLGALLGRNPNSMIGVISDEQARG